MESILLVGGFGFTGIHLINKIESPNRRIIVYSQNDNDVYGLVKNPSRIIHEHGDITDAVSLDNVIQKYRPQVVVNMAALTGIKRCFDDPKKAFTVNVYGTFNVIMSSAKTKSRLVFLSSREVYGESSNSHTSEDDPKIPNNIYGLTKLQAENIILWANKKYGLNYTIVRPTNLYGPGGDKYGAQVLIKKIINDEKIQILGGTQRMNFIYVEDVASAIERIISDERSLSETFNVGSHNDLTINEFVNLVAKISGKKPMIEYLPMRKTETLDFKVSIEKIRKVLDWSPQMDLESGLSSTINWYEKQIQKQGNKT